MAGAAPSSTMVDYMNTIEFKITKRKEEESDIEYFAAHIFIDGRDLIEMLREFERPFAEKENAAHRAGEYEGLEPWLLHSNLTGTSTWYNNQRIVLECICGCTGCWDFFAEVIEDDTKVIWTHFLNAHRGPKSDHFWDYSAFKDFCFDKEEYDQELTKLKNY